MDESYVLEIEWAEGDGPPRVGPFNDRETADQWASKHVANGSWMVCAVAWPYNRRRPAL